MARIRLICWNQNEAREGAEKLGSSGDIVEFEPFERETMKKLRENPPDAIVIDLGRIPSQGRDLALLFRKAKSTRFIPLVFVGGDPEKLERIKKLLPDAAFATWEDIHATLREFIANPPVDPVVPDSTFQAYAKTPLPKKLGIKMGMTVFLVNAPTGFENTLEDLPDSVKITRNSRVANDLVIWFTRSKKELEDGVAEIMQLAGKSGLWIAWPKKAAGHKTDLSQNVVREIGLASGLVDYKISSINDIWSGLRFTRRNR
jgi:hypothetical protein